MNQAIADERFLSFVEKPTAKKFQRLQKQIFAIEQYDPDSDELRFLDRLFARGQFERVLDMADSMQDVWKLSPRFHYLIGNAAAELAQNDVQNYAQQSSKAVMHALLDTGDGTLDAPFEITYFQDEIDLAMVLRVDIREQSVVETDQGFCDVFTLHDGNELWFDTQPLISKRLRYRSVSRFTEQFLGN